MGQQRILGINAGTHLIHTRSFRKYGYPVCRDTVLAGNETKFKDFLDMQFAVLVGRREQHLHSYILRLDTSQIDDDLALKFVALAEHV